MKRLADHSKPKGLFVTFACVALVLAVSGCASTSNANGPEIPVSPLVDLLEIMGSPEPSDETQHFQGTEVDWRREAFIAQCMLELGFEYVPSVGGSLTVFPTPPEDRQWVERWGYGRVDAPWGGSLFWEHPGFEENPNIAITATMTPEEIAQYNIALWGSRQMGDLDAGFLESGCHARAQSEVNDGVWNNDEFAPLRDLWLERSQRIDELSMPVHLDWANCMADAGHPGFDHQMGPTMRITTWPLPTNVDSRDNPRVQALQEMEIALALADFDCRVETDFRQRIAAITLQVDQQFAEDHAEMLAALRDAHAQFQLEHSDG
jgi:hypothetical protein